MVWGFPNNSLIQVLVDLPCWVALMYVYDKGCGRSNSVAIGVVVGMCFGGGGYGGVVLLKKFVMMVVFVVVGELCRRFR